MVVKLGPLPVSELLPSADQVKVYGEVPPVAEALQVTGLPVVAESHVTVTTICWGVTTKFAIDDFLTLFASVAVAFTG